MSEKAFYVTTPIYYVNDVPHIGHAYTTIAADVLARYHRLRGDRVLFVTGTDEHGQKIQRTAEQQGITAQQLADRTVTNFRELWKTLGISNDDFIRTTENRHEEVVRHIFRQLSAQGDIYKGTYEGWYCVPCESYVPEAQIAEDRTCPDCGRPLEWMTEESYFFRSSRYARPLLEYYEEHPGAIRPRGRYNEIVSFLRQGLKDQSVSRTTLDWGIPVPDDEKHVVYVWFDALINYLSACGYPRDEEKVRTFWPAVTHLVGKDITRFHCIIWPSMLLALGLEPPSLVFAHGWWTVEGRKMSKSLGNVVDPFEMVELYGRDAFRYFLLREVTFGLDGDFSEEALVQRINADLANDLGNLLNRSLQMLEKFCDGTLPAPGPCNDLDRELQALAGDTVAAVDEAMQRCGFDEALRSIWTLVRRGNKYIDETMPWKLGREQERERLATVLNSLCQVLRTTAILIAPFLPDTAKSMWEQLGLPGTPDETGLADSPWGGMPEGTRVHKGGVLFPRIDMKEWSERKLERDMKKGKPVDPGDHEETIAIDDFARVELRVAVITAAEPVKGADKLFRITADLGYEERTIVSGIREHFTAEELIGKKIVVVCNLKPAKLRGVTSNGMLCAAETPDGKGLSLLTVDSDITLGSRVH
ncbi:MAG: methionine--tRNA ligase [Synergistales bacterium]|nr:methionine--tRNA ligase [Synergistales bacterium]